MTIKTKLVLFEKVQLSFLNHESTVIDLLQFITAWNIESRNQFSLFDYTNSQ